MNGLFERTTLLIVILGPLAGFGADLSGFSGPTLVQIYNTESLKNPAMEHGRRVFKRECAECHGDDGIGKAGVPDLTTGIWLWGGSLSEIETTIRYGIRSGHGLQRFSEMPGYRGTELLTEQDIKDQVEYVIAISLREADKEAVSRAKEKFESICSECHDYDGTGRREYYGAPDLTDYDWIYGDSRDDIYKSIADGRLGASPAFEDKLDNETIKAVSIFVYSLSHY